MKLSIDRYAISILGSGALLLLALWLFDLVNFEFLKPLLLLVFLCVIVVWIALVLDQDKKPKTKDMKNIYDLINDQLVRQPGGNSNRIIWSDLPRLHYEEKPQKDDNMKLHDCAAILTDTLQGHGQRKLIIFDITDNKIRKLKDQPNEYEAGNVWHNFSLKEGQYIPEIYRNRHRDAITFNINKDKIDNSNDEPVPGSR